MKNEKKINNLSKIETAIKGAYILKKRKIIDNRGNFSRFFSTDEFSDIGIEFQVNTVNYSFTKKFGTFRGLHYQSPPHTEIKIVSCIQGKIIDFCLDIRKDSSSFLSHHSEILSEQNNKSLIIPHGCAHGFQTLTDNCKILYLHSSPYVAEAERGLNIYDKKINIDLPINISEISERDRNLNFINDDFSGV